MGLWYNLFMFWNKNNREGFNMNLNQLYYFKAIAELEHFRLAAEKLNVAQPSLSASMANLEAELSVTLFEKEGRNVKLTKAGKIFLEYVEKSLKTLEAGVNKMKELNKENISLAYVFPLSADYIPKTIKEFLNENKNEEISFSLKQELTPDIIAGLKSSKYDFGFCSKIEEEKDIIFEPIIEQQIVLLAPKNHVLAKKKEIELKEIEKFDFIIYFKESGLGQFIRKIFVDEKINPQIKFEADNEQGIIGLVSQNFGIALVGKTPMIENSDLVQIKIKNLKHKRYIYLAYLKNKQMKKYTKKFFNYIKKNFVK